VGSDKELAERVAKLEKLLKKVASERGTEEQSPTPAPPSLPPSAVIAQPSAQTNEVPATEASAVDAENWQDQNDLLQPHVIRSGSAYGGVSFWEDIMQQVSLSSQFARVYI
jgi:hypothetical protein